MTRTVETPRFATWLSGLRDTRARTKIAQRLARAPAGHLGDVRPVGGGVSELRIDYGPGYRIYVWRRGEVLTVLLCGGTKDTQDRDIAEAKALAAVWRE